MRGYHGYKQKSVQSETVIIFANPPLEAMLLELAKRGIDAAGFEGGYSYPKAAAVLRNNKLAAIAVYHDYRPPCDIQMSFYALTPRWAHMSTIRDLLSYPFLQLGVQRVTAMVKRSNKRSRKMVTGLGWKLEGVVRRAAKDGTDLMLYGMLNTEYGERYGQVRSTFATAGQPGIWPVRVSNAAGHGQTGGVAASAPGPGQPDRSASGVRSGAEPAVPRAAGPTQIHNAPGQREHRLRLAHG